MVIGMGNPLRGDDGIGWRLAARIRAQAGLTVLRRQQLTPELVTELAVVDRVLFLDALVDWGDGSAFLESGETSARGMASAKRLSQGLAQAQTPRLGPAALPLQIRALAALGQQPSQAAWAGAGGWAGGSHGLSPEALLAACQLLGGPAAQAGQLLLPALSFGHGASLSPGLEALLPEAQRLIQAWIDDAPGRLPLAEPLANREPAAAGWLPAAGAARGAWGHA